MVAPFIGQKIGEDQKKVFVAKRVQFSVRKYVMTKKKRSLPTNQWVFGFKRKKKKQMVSPQNGDIRGEPPPSPPPSYATDHLCKRNVTVQLKNS